MRLCPLPLGLSLLLIAVKFVSDSSVDHPSIGVEV